MKQEDKNAIYQLCKEKSIANVNEIKQAISAAQNAANAETKSTAGDKHDTSRAMMQLEVEQLSKRLMTAEKMLQSFTKFSPDSGKNKISLGSMVSTDSATYYLSVGLGKIEFNNQPIFVISPASPVGNTLLGKKKGDTFIFNGKNFEIKSVI